MPALFLPGPTIVFQFYNIHFSHPQETFGARRYHASAKFVSNFFKMSHLLITSLHARQWKQGFGKRQCRLKVFLNPRAVNSSSKAVYSKVPTPFPRALLNIDRQFHRPIIIFLSIIGRCVGISHYLSFFYCDQIREFFHSFLILFSKSSTVGTCVSKVMRFFNIWGINGHQIHASSNCAFRISII